MVATFFFFSIPFNVFSDLNNLNGFALSGDFIVLTFELFEVVSCIFAVLKLLFIVITRLLLRFYFERVDSSILSFKDWTEVLRQKSEIF